MKIALFWLFFLSLSFAVQEVEIVAQYNIGIASELLGKQNACKEPERQASSEDPFEVGYLEILAIVPSVGNITSDLAEPSILWSWFAKAPNSAVFSTESQQGCPAGSYEIYLPSKPALQNAFLEYWYGGEKTEIALGSFGPNPVLLNLPLLGGKSNKDSLYQNLSIRIRGEIVINYHYKKTEYLKDCQIVGGFEACGCKEKSEFGLRQYRKHLQASREFLVETGKNEILWINPPLQRRLDGKQEAQVALFARRMPSYVGFYADGNLVADSQPYQFKIVEGRCEERIALADYLPIQNGMAIAKSQEEMDVGQLVLENLARLPFLLEFPWEGRGKIQTLIEVEDWFGFRQNFSKEFWLREPAPFKADGSSMQIRKGSESLSPAAAVQAPNAEFPSLPLAAAAVLVGFALIAISRKAQ